MGTKITLSSILLVLITLAFIFKEPAKETQISYSPSPDLSQFIIGASGNGKETNYSILTNTLGLNLWHFPVYGGRDGNGNFFLIGWTEHDQLENHIDLYRTEIQNKLTDNLNNGMRTLMARPKIERLAYGQRSDYQCEESNLDPDLWFYAYSTHGQGADQFDNDPNYGSDTWVRYCSPNQTNAGAGWVVSGLKANREQVNAGGSTTGDRDYGWIVKPRIRADRNYVLNHSDEEICRIDVINYDNTVIKSTLIRARNLKDENEQYDGKYKEEFRFTGNDEDLIFSWQESINFNPEGKFYYVPENTCHADFKVYWYGSCDMWIDYVRVDNDIADGLMNPNSSNYNTFNLWIEWEGQLANYTTSPWKFYIEEFEFNNIPAMTYVSKHLKNYTSNVSFMCDVNYTAYNTVVPFTDYNLNYLGAEHIQRFLVDSVGMQEIFLGSYPLGGYDPNRDPLERDPLQETPIPYTLCGWQQYDSINGMLTYGTTVRAYEDTLANHFDKLAHHYWSYMYWTKTADTLTKMAEIPFINYLQTHLGGIGGYRLREPMNEEMDMMANLAITYGAKGIIYYTWRGIGCLPHEGSGRISYERGLVNQVVNPPSEPCNYWNPTNFEPRYTNVYGQQKWQKIIDMSKRFKAWGPYLMSFDNDNRHSYIFRLEEERNALLNPSNSYFYDVLTYKIGSGPFPCVEDYPEGYPAGWIGECKNERYIQVATYKKTIDDGNRYFMLVNRRCSPLINESSEDNNGGQRWIKLRFRANHPAFAVYNSWKIVDLYTGIDVAIFDKRYYSFLDMGKFMPGEGKLYKITPVPRAGGTLVADEYVENQTFTCEDTVWNDGYNITISGQSVVRFSDSATIIMDGGTFQSGDASGGPVSNKITYTSAVSGHKWGGLRFSDANVKIYNSEFKEIASPAGGGFAINAIDCPLNDIRYNIFTSSTDTAGGINIAYVNYSIFGAPPNSYVMYNTFTMNNSYSRAVQVQGFAGLTEGVYVKGNIMTSNGYATGVFLSTVTGGVIKSNTISGFVTAINTMSSTCDLYGNTISNSTIESKGVYAVESSVLNLAPSGSQWTGGMNNISNTVSNSINLDIDASNFILTSGANAFDLLTTAEEPYHLYGSFVSESYNSNATGNCFKLSGTAINDPELPNNYLTDGYEQITLDFIAYNCSQSMPECSDIVSIGNGLYDTIPRTCGGGGGNKSETSNVKSETGTFVLTAKQLQDSIKIQMRHRNYSRVKILCNELIGNYPESIESISSLQTLFMASILSDTTTASRSALKAIYEGLILNHGSNAALVEISNYLVQKCKVLLKQYTSALAGFQAIINNNQYNYRGLLARWDYMATSLLMQGAGGGNFGSEATVSLHSIGIVDEVQNESEEFDEYDKLGDDKNPYSKEERVTIQKNIRTVYEKTKNYGEKRIEILEREARQNNQRAKNELQRISTMKQVIKVEKPKNVIEHIKIVNNDIQTVFGSTLSNKSTSINNIPSVYSLAQNYPNPFNPVTTIKYELPKDSKVKLVVYDLLGREVRTLVNEVKSAGYYTIEFNMQNYASGVYFYRVEADDLNGKKFVDAKKMVLVK